MKVYVIIRDDLSEIYAGIQGCHAVVELIKKYCLEEWSENHKTLVFLKTKNDKLEYLFEKVKTEKKAMFYEPDINANTAFAFLGDYKEPITRKLQVYTGKTNEELFLDASKKRGW